jgi:hypothetical protein
MSQRWPGLAVDRHAVALEVQQLRLQLLWSKRAAYL